MIWDFPYLCFPYFCPCAAVTLEFPIKTINKALSSSISKISYILVSDTNLII